MTVTKLESRQDYVKQNQKYQTTNFSATDNGNNYFPNEETDFMEVRLRRTSVPLVRNSFFARPYWSNGPLKGSKIIIPLRRVEKEASQAMRGRTFLMTDSRPVTSSSRSCRKEFRLSLPEVLGDTSSYLWSMLRPMVTFKSSS